MRIVYALLVSICLCLPVQAATRTDLAHAIAKQEGFFVRHSRAARNHNPGNIKRGPGYVRFKSDREGWQALEVLLSRMLDGSNTRYSVNMTLKEFGKIYSNDPRYWAKNVAKYLGVSPSTRLWEILDTYPRVKGVTCY